MVEFVGYQCFVMYFQCFVEDIVGNVSFGLQLQQFGGVDIIDDFVVDDQMCCVYFVDYFGVFGNDQYVGLVGFGIDVVGDGVVDVQVVFEVDIVCDVGGYVDQVVDCVFGFV